MECNEIRQLEKNFKDLNFSYFINTKIESAHILYTNTLGVFNDSPDNKFDIQSRLANEIEKNECRSFVVFGDSGSGKTSLALHLCNAYWKKISKKSEQEIKKNQYIPIYISLRQIELQNDCKNVLTTFCENSPGKIKPADLYNWNLLLFLDGYDELDEKINLWDHNNWWQPDYRKTIKTVTFCKTIGLKESERDQCFTFGYNEKSKFISVQSFETAQIEDYVRKTVLFLRNISLNDENVLNDPWMMTKKVTELSAEWEKDTTEYQKWFTTTFPDLKKLAGNPYLLTIILQILPGIVEDCKQSAISLNVSEQERAIRIRCSTEVGIYDEFVSQWFKYQATKNRKNKSHPDFLHVPVYHQTEFMNAYAQNLAFTLVQRNSGFLGDGSVSEADSNLWHLWKPIHNKELLDLSETDAKYLKLFPNDPDDKDERRKSNLLLLRSVCFLSNSKIGSFKFFHSSLVEYLASREVFENIRGRFNFYLNSDDPIYDNEFGINTTDLNDIGHRPLLRNLAQRAQINQSVSSLLFEIIAKSTEILILSQMSANAITILNFAGISLSGMDFQNVQIAKANLSGANTANSDFQFANLANANLQQSWMVGCKFQGANLDGVNFGQNCSVGLGFDSVVGMVPYMKNGENNIILSYESGKVDMYNISSEAIREIQCQNVGERHRLYIVGDAQLCQTFHEDDNGYRNSPLYNFSLKEMSLSLNVWSLSRNNQMEAIVDKNPKPALLPAKYWISKEFLGVTDSEASTSTVILKDTQTPNERNGSVNEGRKDNLELIENKIFLDEIRGKKNFYYYEIKVCKNDELSLVVLWGYIFQEMNVVKYRVPQILDSFQTSTRVDDNTLIRFYSDFPIYSCDICMNKLVAIKGQNFVVIFSIFASQNVLFKDNFQRDSVDSDNDDIKFSSNGRYLIYKSDFVYLCIIGEVRVESIVKLLEVDADDITVFLVAFDKCCEMSAFSYENTIFICKLSSGTIIQKMYTQDGLIFSLFPTFTFVDLSAGDSESTKLLCYVSSNSHKTALETIVIADTIEPTFQRKVKELGKFCVSNDNSRVAAYYTISKKEEMTKTDILSVFTTPISSQTMLFQKQIHSSINKMMFTSNYLLVIVDLEILVLDMNGNFFPSVKFPTELNIRTFSSSKYQCIVLCSENDKRATLQLCSIVETATYDPHISPIAIDNIHKHLYNIYLCPARLTFDSNDGSHMLIKSLWDDENIWLWIPSKDLFLKVAHVASMAIINDFYMINEGEMCLSNQFGCHYLKTSSNDSVKTRKVQYHLYHYGYKNIKSRFYLHMRWYTYGNSDGKLYIHDLKTNICLIELLFPHAVEDFNLSFNYSSGDILESVDILAWDLDDNISSLVIENVKLKTTDAPNSNNFHKWKLKWTIKTNLALNFQNSVIAKSYKVNDTNKKLLNNLNINLEIGEPWPEKIDYFSLSELYMPITEMDTKFAIINTKDSGGPRMPIMADMWVVSVVARNSNSKSNNIARIEHVGFLIEGINNGRHFVMEAELTANKRKGYVRIKLVPVSTRERLDQLKKEYIARQWMRRKSDVQMLIRSIQNDQIEGSRKYNLLHNNCATWCMGKLKEIGIKKDRKKWYRKVFVADLPSDLFSMKDRLVKNRLPFKPSK